MSDSLHEQTTRTKLKKLDDFVLSKRIECYSLNTIQIEL